MVACTGKFLPPCVLIQQNILGHAAPLPRTVKMDCKRTLLLFNNDPMITRPLWWKSRSEIVAKEIIGSPQKQLELYNSDLLQNFYTSFTTLFSPATALINLFVFWKLSQNHAQLPHTQLLNLDHIMLPVEKSWFFLELSLLLMIQTISFLCSTRCNSQIFLGFLEECHTYSPITLIL